MMNSNTIVSQVVEYLIAYKRLEFKSQQYKPACNQTRESTNKLCGHCEKYVTKGNWCITFPDNKMGRHD